MKDKRSFIVYFDRKKELDMLTDEQVGRLFRYLISYADSGLGAPDNEDICVKLLFSVMSSAIDENNAKYAEKCKRNQEIAIEREKNKRDNQSTNVHERARTCTNVHERARESTKSTDTDTDTETETETETETDIILTDNSVCGGKSAEQISAPAPAKKKSAMHKHGEYGHVRLTDEQHKKLIGEYGQQTVDTYIRKIDEYCQLKGKLYKDYNLAIRNWISRDNQEKPSGDVSSGKERVKMQAYLSTVNRFKGGDSS